MSATVARTVRTPVGEASASIVWSALKGVSFDVPDNATVALVGESGSGKSVSALAIMGLLPTQNARVALHSKIEYDGRSLLNLSRPEWQLIRGSRIAMIFQDPMTSLNPVYTVGFQLAEMLQVHKRMSSKESLARACDLLAEVGIPEPQKRINAYPHELSGGQARRVSVARALALQPKLVIADEPTAGLDVSVQAEILNLMTGLRRDLGLSFLIITHNPITMARMNRLFGVTMAERGVSQLVSVDLRQAEAMAAQ